MQRASFWMLLVFAVYLLPAGAVMAVWGKWDIALVCFVGGPTLLWGLWRVWRIADAGPPYSLGGLSQAQQLALGFVILLPSALWYATRSDFPSWGIAAVYGLPLVPFVLLLGFVIRRDGWRGDRKQPDQREAGP